jgi:bifunctional NMN adenylyltransferase/nudix hydrolase
MIKNMNLKHENTEIINNAEVGVVIGRFQTNQLHEGHLKLINFVLSKHKKTIILLGVSRIQNTRKNPLDFASRKAMIQSHFPTITILPVMDERSDEVWSKSVDSMVSVVYGDKSTVIYGSRDSFIPYYKGRFNVVELDESQTHNATNIRLAVAKETLDTVDFRAGVIYANFNQRPVTYPTVDVCAYNNKGEILMAKKPHEKLWRFVGGFVDREDVDYEAAAKREFSEETGGNCSLINIQYIASQKVDDWRYRKEDSGIMTTLFIGESNMGMAKASDDIVDVKWIHISEFSNYDGIRTKVMVEHRDLMVKLIDKVYSNNLIPNIGERLAERTGDVTYIGE